MDQLERELELAERAALHLHDVGIAAGDLAVDDVAVAVHGVPVVKEHFARQAVGVGQHGEQHWQKAEKEAGRGVGGGGGGDGGGGGGARLPGLAAPHRRGSPKTVLKQCLI